MKKKQIVISFQAEIVISFRVNIENKMNINKQTIVINQEKCVWFSEISIVVFLFAIM